MAESRKRGYLNSHTEARRVQVCLLGIAISSLGQVNVESSGQPAQSTICNGHERARHKMGKIVHQRAVRRSNVVVPRS